MTDCFFKYEMTLLKEGVKRHLSCHWEQFQGKISALYATVNHKKNDNLEIIC